MERWGGGGVVASPCRGEAAGVPSCRSSEMRPLILKVSLLLARPPAAEGLGFYASCACIAVCGW